MATWNAEKRRRAASSGAALPDGSYPIADCSDVRDAARLVGRSKTHSTETVRRHIIKRARAIGCTSSLPEGWD